MPDNPLLTGLCWLLAPGRCAGCDLPFDDATHRVCEACEPLLDPTPAGLQPPRSSAAAYLYQGPLADAVRRFKYAQRTELAPYLGGLLARTALAYAGCVERVVPMPLHPAKLRARGYNPAALLARYVARELGVPLDVSLLSRLRATRNQAGLDREARARNVRGAFAARAGARAARVLLLDDVRTTGATLAEAAAALSSHGHEVTTLALAWTPS
jgi:ComF family protein